MERDKPSRGRLRSAGQNMHARIVGVSELDCSSITRREISAIVFRLQSEIERLAGEGAGTSRVATN